LATHQPLFKLKIRTMLDKLLVKRDRRKDIFTSTYTPQQAITDRKLVNASGKNLYVLFPGWHGGRKPYERLIKRLTARGDAILAYYFNDEIFKPDTEQVKASFAHIRDTVARELTELTSSHDYAQIRLVGMSLGNAALAVVVGAFHDFDSVTTVFSASSLARGMWYGTRTQHARAGIEATGHDLAYVETAWHDLALINHLTDLTSKDVSMLVSTTDKVAPTRYQMELVDAVRASGINPHVQTTKLGHYAAISRYCLYDKI